LQAHGFGTEDDGDHASDEAETPERLPDAEY
jgi:hypothetical protein